MSKVEIHLTIVPVGALDPSAQGTLYVGSGSTVRIAAMRAIEKAVMYSGEALRKGSEKVVTINVRRAK